MEATNTNGTVQRWNWDPSVPPDWGARDAARLVAGESAEWANEGDLYVPKYADFLRLLNRTGDVAPRDEDAQETRIGIAHRIHEEKGTSRWELEARLLAGESDQEIGAKCGVAPEVVAIYERLFCSVRDCLTSRDYLLAHLVGPGVQCGFGDEEVGNFWAWIAIAGGPAVLENFIATFSAARRRDQPARLSIYLQPDAGVPLNMQATVAAAVLPDSEPAAEAFRGNHLLLIEAQAAEDPDRAGFLREKARDSIIRCARAFLAGKPLPRPRRWRPPPNHKGNTTRALLPKKGKPMTFKMWEDLVTAAFSKGHTGKRKKS